MDKTLIQSHLNLLAVFRSLEELPRLDPESAALCRDWDLTVQFTVRNGPRAFLEFKAGTIRHGEGSHSNPSIHLFFFSPRHLNALFEGTGVPLPVKGFLRLGFLKSGFAQLTGRLTHFLRPESDVPQDEPFVRVNTALSLFTAAHAVRELARLDPLSRQIAAQTPRGALQIEILPDGPHVYLLFEERDVCVARGKAPKPMAKMIFQDIRIAHALLNGRIDSLRAVASGDLVLYGQIPMVDNLGLLLERVEHFLA